MVMLIYVQGTVQRWVGGYIRAQGAYLSRAMHAKFVHGSFVQMIRPKFMTRCATPCANARRATRKIAAAQVPKLE